jgi:hypothetical protein
MPECYLRGAKGNNEVPAQGVWQSPIPPTAPESRTDSGEVLERGAIAPDWVVTALRHGLRVEEAEGTERNGRKGEDEPC